MEASKVQLIIHDATAMLKAGMNYREVAQSLFELHEVSLNDARFLFILAGLCARFGVKIKEL